MKLSKLSQLGLATVIGLVVATLLSACQLVTVDYVFLGGQFTPANGAAVGSIEVFAADSESGALRAVVGSDTAPFAAGGIPVAMAVTPDYAHLYVANSDNNTIVHFTIDATGKLTQKDTVTLTARPAALQVDSAGKVLYVVSGSTSAFLQSFPLSSGTIGAMAAQQALTIPGFASDKLAGTALTVLQNGKGVFATVTDVSAYNPGGTVTSGANPGWIFGFTTDATGTLTAGAGSPWHAGVKPTGIVADPTNTYLYFVDFASNQMAGFTILNSSSLQYINDGPYKTGSQPTGIAIDPRGRFLYVSNALDSTITAYEINLATGIPAQALSTSGTENTSTDTDPVAVTVEPALGRYVYTANFLGNSISGFRLNPNTGAVSRTQATPYPSLSRATCVLAIPHGNHAVQVVSQ